ncbi:MAG TPA: DUF3810 family protein [Saprospiraceae bacterium]|nr:DUF3810 family protein [Saprospiraceae bacterium]HMP14526.1 DUF3810 family protein [Saprospiraceae bacterium]
MDKSHRYRGKIIWIGLGLGSILLRWIAGPTVIENWYSRGIFLYCRLAIDYLLAWLPIPLMYVLLPVVLVLIGRRVVRWYGAPRSPIAKIGQAVLGIMAFLGGVVFLFLWLWGFNYGRVPVETQIGLETQPLNMSQLKEELRLETQAIIALRPDIAGITDTAFTSDLLLANLEKHLRHHLRERLRQYNFPTSGRVRGRILYPKGIFLRFSSAGLYFPWTGEGHIDAGLHPLQIPYVMAHEMAHGFGFGDEGDCNFWAYLACIASEEPAIAYAGHLAYWRDLAADYRRYDPEGYPVFRKSLPIGIQADLDAINHTLLQYPDIFPKLRYAAYDAYLRTQGIEEGMLNYDRVTMLVHAWRKSKQL